MASDTSEAPVVTESHGPGGEDGEEAQRLDLNVSIDPRGACQRHVTVTISRGDIDRHLEKAYGKLMTEANVPGFRIGHAPKALVVKRFRKEISQQVRGELLLASVEQVTEDHKLAAISEPDFDPLAIEIPDEGPMTFEFDLEVRPEFDVPNWKGLKIERPKHDFTDAEVDERLREVLVKYADNVPKDGPAALGDYLSVDIIVKHGEQTINVLEEELVRVLPVLSFRDGAIKGFDKLMVGVEAGQTKQAKLRVSRDAANEALRGQEVSVDFKVVQVRRVELPELTPALLEGLGVESEQELRNEVKRSLERQREYQANRAVRDQITAALVQSADWDLPPDLLRRQARRELERSVLELRRSGYSEAEIRAHENELRQNSQVETARALKEHFILERIAEEEKIEEEPGDYDEEISLIAYQLGESPRRVRARIEKAGQMDVLRNQIIERKVIDRIVEHAKFKDVPYEVPRAMVEAVDHSAAGGDKEGEIPEAQREAEGAAAEEGAAEESTK
jgi:trigger factor